MVKKKNVERETEWEKTVFFIRMSPRMAFTYFTKSRPRKKNIHRLHLMFAYPNEQQALDDVERKLFYSARLTWLSSSVRK